VHSSKWFDAVDYHVYNSKLFNGQNFQ